MAFGEALAVPLAVALGVALPLDVGVALPLKLLLPELDGLAPRVSDAVALPLTVLALYPRMNTFDT
mgnify:CR=1 FL=1